MRNVILGLVLTAVALFQAGCAADFRAGGEHRGVAVGASIPPAPVYLPPVPASAPPPQP